MITCADDLGYINNKDHVNMQCCELVINTMINLINECTEETHEKYRNNPKDISICDFKIILNAKKSGKYPITLYYHDFFVGCANPVVTYIIIMDTENLARVNRIKMDDFIDKLYGKENLYEIRDTFSYMRSVFGSKILIGSKYKKWTWN